MSGPYQVSRIRCYQGVDLEESSLFFSQPEDGSTDLADLVPMDFTGCTARMVVRLRCDPASTQVLYMTSFHQTPGDTPGLVFVSDTFDGGPDVTVNNGIQITITNTQSLAMNSGVQFTGGYYDLLVDTLAGKTLSLMAGQFDLMATVTRLGT